MRRRRRRHRGRAFSSEKVKHDDAHKSYYYCVKSKDCKAVKVHGLYLYTYYRVFYCIRHRCRVVDINIIISNMNVFESSSLILEIFFHFLRRSWI